MSPELRAEAQFDPLVTALLLLVLGSIWLAAVVQWRGGERGAGIERNMRKNIGRYFRQRWVKERVHLILAPLALGGGLTFLSVPVLYIMDPSDSTMPYLVGIALVAPFVAGPVLAIALSVSLVRRGRPRFMVPPHERGEPSGLELRDRYRRGASTRKRGRSR